MSPQISLGLGDLSGMPGGIASGLDSGTTNANGRTRVGAYARIWLRLRAPHIQQRTAHQYAAVLEDHILPQIGDAWIDAIRPIDIQALVNTWIVDGGAPQTVRYFYQVLRTLFADAMDHLSLARDPCRKIRLPPRPDRRGEKRALTPEELRRILDYYEQRLPHLYPLLSVMAHTGLRFAHASALQWGDLDEALGTLQVRRVRLKPAGGDTAPISRNKRAPRVLALPPVMLQVMKAQCARLRASPRRAIREAADLPTGFCFPREDRAIPILPATWNRWWVLACERTGVERARGVGPHALRRTMVDLLRAAGVHGQTGRAITAHASDAQFDRYASVVPAEEREALARVGELIAAAGPARAGSAAQPRRVARTSKLASK